MFKRLFFGFVLVGFIFSATLFYFYNKKLSQSLQKEISITVNKGQSFNSVLNYLQSQANTSALFGKIYLKLKNKNKALKVGDYILSSEMSFKEAIELLTKGQIIEYKVTIPEGYNVFEITELLSAEEIVLDKKNLLNILLNECSGYLKVGDCRTKSLEGFLFPETYNFQKKSQASDVVKALVKHHYKVKNQIYDKTKAKNLSLKNWSEVVTLASVIEKETGASWERPLISSVFHNRLEQGMKLQSDPTTIYGQWLKTKSRLKNIRKRHLLESTGHNTYTVKRLPDGPIANPGKAALKAVLNPEKSDFIYFVSKNDGTHKFTKTYKQHQNAVKEFQLSRGARQGKSWRDLNKK